MIRAVVDFALSHRWFMLAFGIFLFGLGIIQFHHLSIEAYPDVANNYAWIITQWPGRAAEEIEPEIANLHAYLGVRICRFYSHPFFRGLLPELFRPSIFSSDTRLNR